MPAKSRPKTHKRKLGKFTAREVHKLHRLFPKAPRQMVFRRGRAVKGGRMY
jgi:hypothetical protein